MSWQNRGIAESAESAPKTPNPRIWRFHSHDTIGESPNPRIRRFVTPIPRNRRDSSWQNWGNAKFRDFGGVPRRQNREFGYNNSVHICNHQYLEIYGPISENKHTLEPVRWARKPNLRSKIHFLWKKSYVKIILSVTFCDAGTPNPRNWRFCMGPKLRTQISRNRRAQNADFAISALTTPISRNWRFKTPISRFWRSYVTKCHTLSDF